MLTMPLYAKCDRCGCYDLVTLTGDIPDVPRGWATVSACGPLPAVTPNWGYRLCGICADKIEAEVNDTMWPVPKVQKAGKKHV